MQGAGVDDKPLASGREEESGTVRVLAGPFRCGPSGVQDKQGGGTGIDPKQNRRGCETRRASAPGARGGPSVRVCPSSIWRHVRTLASGCERAAGDRPAVGAPSAAAPPGPQHEHGGGPTSGPAGLLRGLAPGRAGPSLEPTRKMDPAACCAPGGRGRTKDRGGPLTSKTDIHPMPDPEAPALRVPFVRPGVCVESAIYLNTAPTIKAPPAATVQAAAQQSVAADRPRPINISLNAMTPSGPRRRLNAHPLGCATEA